MFPTELCIVLSSLIFYAIKNSMADGRRYFNKVSKMRRYFSIKKKIHKRRLRHKTSNYIVAFLKECINDCALKLCKTAAQAQKMGVHISVFKSYSTYHILYIHLLEWNGDRKTVVPEILWSHLQYISTIQLLMIWQNMTKAFFFFHFFFSYPSKWTQPFHHVFHCRSDSLVGTVWCAVVHFEESMKVSENVLQIALEENIVSIDTHFYIFPQVWNRK